MSMSQTVEISVASHQGKQSLPKSLKRKMEEELFNVNKIPSYSFYFMSQNVCSMFVFSPFHH